MPDVHQYYTVYHDEDDRSVDSWTGPLALKSIAGRCRCGWRGQRRPDTAESGVLAFNEWWSEHYTPLVRPDPGQLLILSNEDGERRHFLAGRPVRTGVIIELLLSGGHWVPVRYEWSARADAAPRFYVELGGPWELVDEHGPETYLLVPLERSVFRWPGTASEAGDQPAFLSEPAPAIDPSGPLELPSFGGDGGGLPERVGPLGGPILPDPPGYDPRDTGTFQAITPEGGTRVFDALSLPPPAPDNYGDLGNGSSDSGYGGNGFNGNGHLDNGYTGTSADLGYTAGPAGTGRYGDYGSALPDPMDYGASNGDAQRRTDGYGSEPSSLSPSSSNPFDSSPFDSSPFGSSEYRPDQYTGGDYGARDYSTGDYSTGDYSTGDYSTGDYSTGDYSTGDYGTGDYGTGDYGTGDYGATRSGIGDYTAPAPASGDYDGGGGYRGYLSDQPADADTTGPTGYGDTAGTSSTYGSAAYGTGGYAGGDFATRDYGTGDHGTATSATSDYDTGSHPRGDDSTGGYRPATRDISDYSTGDYDLGGYDTGSHPRGDDSTGGYRPATRDISDYSTGDYDLGGYDTGSHPRGDDSTGGYRPATRDISDYSTGDYDTGGYDTGKYQRGDDSTGDYGLAIPTTGDQGAAKATEAESAEAERSGFGRALGALSQPLVDPFQGMFGNGDGRSLNRRMGKPLPGNWGGD